MKQNIEVDVRWMTWRYWRDTHSRRTATDWRDIRCHK